MHCSEAIGYYVSVDVWTSLVTSAVKSSAACCMQGSQASVVPTGPVHCTSCLMILGACIQGAKKEKLHPYLKVYTCVRIFTLEYLLKYVSNIIIIKTKNNVFFYSCY